MKGSIAIQILPKVEDEKVFEVVDKVIDYIKSTGLNYVVGPFETTVEGDFNSLMEIIKKSHELVLESGIDVSAYIKTSFTNKEEFWTIDEKTKKHIH